MTTRLLRDRPCSPKGLGSSQSKVTIALTILHVALTGYKFRTCRVQMHITSTQVRLVSHQPSVVLYRRVSAESQLEDYKHGAFLEKADRFSKEKHSQVPGHCCASHLSIYTYTLPGPDVCEQRKSSKPPLPASKQSLSDRYSVLQRKVEDLERVHNDSKKSV